MYLIVKPLSMNLEELKDVNLTILSMSFQIKALKSCLTTDQKIIFEASLEESKSLVRNKLAKSLNPEELHKLLKALEFV